MVSGVIGAVIGLLGTAISKWTDIYEKKNEDRYQLEAAKNNVEIARLELQKEQIRASSEEKKALIDARARADEAVAKADSATMIASYAAAKDMASSDTSTFGSLIRGIIRPFLTLVYSALFLTVVYYAATPEIIQDQAEAVFGAFIEVSVAITLWWFGLTRKGK